MRAGSVWEVSVGGRVVETTAEHPFWVRGLGWVAACHLRAGDAVRLLEGYASVEGVRDTGRWERVYNGRVAEYHTYFVGCDDWGFAVWVHNANEAYGGNYGKLGASKKAGRAGGKNGTQLDHLNQDAAYGRSPTVAGNKGTAIPRKEGAATPLEGGIGDRGGQHNLKHQVLEDFWNEARVRFNETRVAPTNAEYGEALSRALRESGLSPKEAHGLADSARRQRISYGHLDADPVPNIPNPIPPHFLPR